MADLETLLAEVEALPEPDSTPESVFGYLRSKGVSSNHARGMVANIQAESAFKSGIQQPGVENPGLGLFQYTEKTRKKNFLNAVPDWEFNWKGQVDFALSEKLTEQFLAQEFATPQEASEWFTKKWERPANAVQRAQERKKNVALSSDPLEDLLLEIENTPDEVLASEVTGQPIVAPTEPAATPPAEPPTPDLDTLLTEVEAMPEDELKKEVERETAGAPPPQIFPAAGPGGIPLEALQQQQKGFLPQTIKEGVKRFVRGWSNLARGLSISAETVGKKDRERFLNKIEETKQKIAAEKDPEKIRELEVDLDLSQKVLGAIEQDRDFFKKVDKAANKVLDSVKVSPDFKQETGAKGWVQNAIMAGTQLPPAMVAGLLTGPLGAATTMGGFIAGSTIEELEAEDVETERAVIAGVGNAIAQAPLEAIGIGKMLRAWRPGQTGKQILKSIFESGLTEGFTEFLQTGPEAVATLWGKTEGKPNSERIEMLIDDSWNIFKQAVYEGSIGLAVGGVGGGGGAVFTAGSPQVEQEAVAPAPETGDEFDIAKKQVQEATVADEVAEEGIKISEEISAPRKIVLGGRDKTTDLGAVADRIQKKRPEITREAALAAADEASLNNKSLRPSEVHMNSFLKTPPPEGSQRVAVFYDMDEFKRFNDKFGQAAGDQIIAGLQQGIGKTSDATGHAQFHIGGDEGVILSDLTEEQIPAFLDQIESIKNEVNETRIVDEKGQEIPISLSMGVKINDVDGAEKILKAGKKKHKNSINLHSDIKKTYNREDVIGEDILPQLEKFGLTRTRAEDVKEGAKDKIPFPRERRRQLGRPVEGAPSGVEKTPGKKAPLPEAKKQPEVKPPTGPSTLEEYRKVTPRKEGEVDAQFELRTLEEFQKRKEQRGVLSLGGPDEEIQARREAQQQYGKQTAADIDAEIEVLRGKKLSLKASQIIERAKLSLAVRNMRGKREQAVRDQIYQYARESGIRGFAFNRVDTLIKNAKTQNALSKALDVIDDTLEKKTNRKLLKSAVELINKERKRIKKAQKTKSLINVKQNQAISDYIDSITYLSERKQKQMRESLEWLENHPESDMTEVMRSKVAESLKPNLAQMSNPEVLQVIEDIKLLRKHGRTKQRIINERKKRQRQGQADLAAKQILAKSKRAPKTPLDKALQKKEGRNWLKEFDLGLLRPERLLETFTMWGENSSLVKNTYNVLRDATYKKMDNIEKANKTLKTLWKNIDPREAITTIGYTLKVGDKARPLTIAQMMAVYAHSQNPGNRNHLYGTGFNDSMIEKITNALPENYKEAVDNTIDFFDFDQWERVNDTFKSEHNVNMRKEHRYFPILNLDLGSPENQINADLMARQRARLASIEKGFTKTRSGSDKPFATLDFFQTVTRSVHNAEHYIAFQEPVNHVMAFLNTPSVKTAMETKDSRARSYVMKWVDAVGRGKVRKSDNWLDVASDYLRTNYTTAVLGGNLVTILKQPASFLQGLGAMSLDEKASAIQTLAKWASNPIGFRNTIDPFINEKSVMMRNRGSQVEREFAEILEKEATRKAIGIQSGWSKFKEMSLGGIKIADKITTDVLWLTKYKSILNKTGNEAQAVEQANRIISRTQPQSGILDLAAIQRGGGLARAFTMFQNQLNQNYNLHRQLAAQFGEKTTRENINRIVFWMALPSLYIAMASTGFRVPEPEEYFEYALQNFLGGVPLLNTMVDVGVKRFLTNPIREARGKGPSKVFERPMTPTSFGAIEDAMRLSRSKDVPTAVDLGIGAVSKTIGVPGYAQGRRVVKGIAGAVEELEAGEPIQAGRRLIWSKYALGDPEPDPAKRAPISYKDVIERTKVARAKIDRPSSKDIRKRREKALKRIRR